jgi:hypothetical protein
MIAMVVVLDGHRRVPLNVVSQNHSTFSSMMVASVLLVERNVTLGNRDHSALDEGERLRSTC